MIENFDPNSATAEDIAFGAMTALESPTPEIEPMRPVLLETVRSYADARKARGLPLFPNRTAQANAQRNAYLRDIFTKPLDQVLPPEAAQKLAAREALHLDPEGYRAREVTRSFLTAITGKPLNGASYDMTRDLYAKQHLGLTGDTSDKAVFNAIRARHQEDDKDAETFTAKLTEGISARLSTVGKLDTTARTPTNAEISGYDRPVKSLEKIFTIEDREKFLSGISERNRPAYRAKWNEANRELTRQFRKHQPLVEEVTSAVAQIRSADNPEEALMQDIVNLAAKLPDAKADREIAMAMIGNAVSNFPEDVRNTWQRMAAGAMRGVNRQLVMGTAKTGQAIGRQALGAFTGMESVRSLDGSGDIVAKKVSGATGFLSDEANVRLQRAAELFDVIAGNGMSLKKVSDNLFQAAFVAAAPSAWMIPAAFVPVGQSAIVSSMGGASMINAETENPNVDEGLQTNAGLGSGMVQGAIESLTNVAGVKVMLGKLPRFAGLLNKAGVTSPAGRAALGAAAGYTAATGMEYTEEALQGATDLAFQALAQDLAGQKPDVDWSGYFKDWLTVAGPEQKETLLAVSAFGMVAGAGASYNHFRYGSALARSKTFLRANGFTEAEVRDITNTTDLDEAAEKTRAAFDAAQARIATATDEDKLKLADLRQQAIEVLRASNEAYTAAGMPRIVQERNEFTEEDQWVFIDTTTGSRRAFETEEEALGAWQDWNSEQSEENIAAIREAGEAAFLETLQAEGAIAEDVNVERIARTVTPATERADAQAELTAAETDARKAITPQQERAARTRLEGARERMNTIGKRVEIFLMERGIDPTNATAAAKALDSVVIKAKSFATMLQGRVVGYTVQLYNGAEIQDIAEDFSETSMKIAMEEGWADPEIILDDIRRYEAASGNRVIDAGYEYDPANRLPLIEGFSKLARGVLMGEVRTGLLPPEVSAWIEMQASLMAVSVDIAKAGAAGSQFATDVATAAEWRKAVAAKQVPARLERLLKDSLGLDTEAQNRRLEKRMEEQLAAEAMDGFPEISDVAKGRLPHPETLRENNHPLYGEVRRIWEALKKPTKRRTKQGRAIDRTNEANAYFLPVGEMEDLDNVRQAVNERGFDFDTITDMLDALDVSISYGKPFYGTQSVGDESFSMGSNERLDGPANLQSIDTNTPGGANIGDAALPEMPRDAFGNPEPKASIGGYGFSWGKNKGNAWFSLESATDWRGKFKVKVEGDSKEDVQKAFSELLEMVKNYGFEVVSVGQAIDGTPSAKLLHKKAAEERNKLEALRDKRINDLKNRVAKEGTPTFLRYGNPPESGKSWNGKDEYYEAGVSVYPASKLKGNTYVINLEGMDTISSMFIREQKNGDIFEVTGAEVVGKGADGEPLLKGGTYRKISKSAKIADLSNFNQSPPASSGESWAMGKADTTVFDAARKPLANTRPMIGAFSREIGMTSGNGWDAARNMSRNAARAIDEGRMPMPEFKGWLSELLGLESVPEIAIRRGNDAAGNQYREYHHMGRNRAEVDFYDPEMIGKSPKFFLGMAKHFDTLKSGKKAAAASRKQALEAWKNLKQSLIDEGVMGDWKGSETKEVRNESQRMKNLPEIYRQKVSSGSLTIDEAEVKAFQDATAELEKEAATLRASVEKREGQIAKWSKKIEAGEKPPYDGYLASQEEALKKDAEKLAAIVEQLEKSSPPQSAEAGRKMSDDRASSVTGSESRQSLGPNQAEGGTMASESFAMSTPGLLRLEAAIAKRMTRGPDERAEFFQRLRDRLAATVLQAREAKRNLATDQTDVERERARIRDAVAEAAAILKALPADARGRVPFSINDVLDADTERGQINALIRLIDKADDALEVVLLKEYREAFETLLDLAKPDLKENKQVRGRLTPETQRMVNKILAVVTLTPAELAIALPAKAAEIEALEATNPTTPEEIEAAQKQLVELYTDQGLLETFGAFSTLDAARTAHAYEQLQSIYVTGRTQRRILDEARKAEIQAAKNEILSNLREVDQGTHAERTNAKGIQAILDQAEAFRLGMSSFHQVMEWIFPRSTVARDFAAKVRKADRAFVRAKLEAKDRFDRYTFGVWNLSGPSRHRKRNRILADLSTLRTDWNIDLQEGVTFATEKLTEQQAAAILDGTMKVGWETDNIAMTSLRQALADFRMQRLKAQNEQRRFTATTIKFQRLTHRGRPGPFIASDLQALYFVQLYAQEQYRPALDKFGFTAEVMEKMQARLNPKAKDLGDFLRDEYDAEWSRLNPVYRRIYGLDMPRIRNYAPGLFEHLDAKGGSDSTIDPYGNTSAVNAMSAGFTKARTHHMARPKLTNAMAGYWSHLEATEYFIAYAELMRDARQIFRNPEVRRRIEGNFGPKVAGIWSQWLDALELDGNFRATEMNALAEMTHRTLATQSAVGLAFNVGVLFKQASAAMGVLLEMPTTAAVKGLALAMAKPSTLRTVWSSEAIQQRIMAGMSPEDRKLLDAAKASPSIIMELLEVGRLPIAYADAGFTTLSGSIAYAYHFQQATGAGMSVTNAEASALAAASRVIERTAQPATAQDKSMAELTAKGFGKFLFLFKSDPRQKLAIVANAIAAAKQDRPGAKAALGRQVLFGWVMYGLMAEIMSDVWAGISRDDDDEDRWSWQDYAAAAIVGPISGLPLLGSGIEYLVRSTVGTKAFVSGQNPIDQGVSKLFPATQKAIDAITSDDKDASVSDILTAAQQATAAMALAAGAFEPRAAIVPAGVRLVRDAFGTLTNMADLLTEPTADDQALEIIREISATEKTTREGKTEANTALAKELAKLPAADRAQRLQRLDADQRAAVKRKLRASAMTSSEMALSKLGKDARAQAIDKITAGMNETEARDYRARLRSLGLE